MSSRLFPVVAALVALAPVGARAQDQTAVQKMIELNRQALAAFGNKDYEGAKSALMDAVVLGKEAGLANDKMMARTYLHLGVVYVDGFKDNEKGQRYFAMAQKVRADIELTPSLATPTVKAAFEAARGQSGAAKAEPAKPEAAKAEPAKPEPAAKEAPKEAPAKRAVPKSGASAKRP